MKAVSAPPLEVEVKTGRTAFHMVVPLALVKVKTAGWEVGEPGTAIVPRSAMSVQSVVLAGEGEVVPCILNVPTCEFAFVYVIAMVSTSASF